MISAIPNDRWVGGMTISPDFLERRSQNDKACKKSSIFPTNMQLPKERNSNYGCCISEYALYKITLN
ncbi:hypothetical protein U3516DRAFT_739944 [Neocallimastix sp. 'constans']